MFVTHSNVRQLFFLDRSQRLLASFFVLDGLHIALAHVADRARQEPACSARGIEQHLARTRIDPLGHERRHRARSVVFARVSRALQVVEHLLVDLSEVLLFREVVEVDIVDLVDDLAHQLTRLHVVVGILEHVADDATAVAGAGDGQLLQGGKQTVADERHERVAGDAFRIGGPGAPLKAFGNRRPIPGVGDFQLLILVVDDLEKEHPAQLGDALGIAIDAGVLAHDVLDRFDRVPDRHRGYAAPS
jgi:hypothetical protein